MKRIYTFLSLLTLSFFLALYLTFIIGKKLEKVIINYATAETERIANVILNDVVELDDNNFGSNLFEISRNNEGNIELINFDTKTTNNGTNALNIIEGRYFSEIS